MTIFMNIKMNMRYSYIPPIRARKPYRQAEQTIIIFTMENDLLQTRQY